MKTRVAFITHQNAKLRTGSVRLVSKSDGSLGTKKESKRSGTLSKGSALWVGGWVGGLKKGIFFFFNKK